MITLKSEFLEFFRNSLLEKVNKGNGVKPQEYKWQKDCLNLIKQIKSSEDSYLFSISSLPEEDFNIEKLSNVHIREIFEFIRDNYDLVDISFYQSFFLKTLTDFVSIHCVNVIPITVDKRSRFNKEALVSQKRFDYTAESRNYAINGLLIFALMKVNYLITYDEFVNIFNKFFSYNNGYVYYKYDKTAYELADNENLKKIFSFQRVDLSTIDSAVIGMFSDIRFHDNINQLFKRSLRLYDLAEMVLSNINKTINVMESDSDIYLTEKNLISHIRRSVMLAWDTPGFNPCNCMSFFNKAVVPVFGMKPSRDFLSGAGVSKETLDAFYPM